MTATHEVSTPSVRVAVKRHRFWITTGVVLALFAVVMLLIRGAGGTEGDPLSPTNAAPAGSKAVAAVLGQHGVSVKPTETLAATRHALREHPSTLLLYDPKSYLDSAELSSLAAQSDSVVLVAPSFTELNALAPKVKLAGAAKTGTLKANCSMPAAVNAGTISGGGNGYRSVDSAGEAVGCFSSGKGIHSIVQLTSGPQQLTILGADQVLKNETIAKDGNAALALNLLGTQAQLVWYSPSPDDTALASGGLKSIGELTPPWVSPVAVLLILTALAAALWRGRRLGPLAIENLPVTVRANETMEGRARLYQKNSTRLRALDALRIGSVTRLARLSGLPRTASTTEVVTAVSRLTGRDTTEVARVLVDRVPANDAELIRRSDELTELEAATARAVSR